MAEYSSGSASAYVIGFPIQKRVTDSSALESVLCRRRTIVVPSPFFGAVEVRTSEH